MREERQAPRFARYLQIFGGGNDFNGVDWPTGEARVAHPDSCVHRFHRGCPILASFAMATGAAGSVAFTAAIFQSAGLTGDRSGLGGTP